MSKSRQSGRARLLGFARIADDLRVRTDEPDHRVELLHRNLRSFGTVFNTLAGSCQVEGELIAERRTAGGGSSR